MSESESTLLKNIKRFEEARDSLKEWVSIARSTLKDLRFSVREGQDLEKRLRELVIEEFQRHIDIAIKKAVDDLDESTSQAMKRSVEKVDSEFNKLAVIYLYGKDGEGNVHEAALATQRGMYMKRLRRLLDHVRDCPELAKDSES